MFRFSSASQPAFKVLRRAFKLLVWGLIIQGAWAPRVLGGRWIIGVDLATLRVCGILQRIAVRQCGIASWPLVS